MKKETAIKHINNISKKSMNSEQKEVAINILNKASTHEEVSLFYNLLIQKVKVGLTFDEANNIPNGKIALIEYDENKSIINKGRNNKFIIGDNYNSLKILRITHKEKIDIIYIDPPYNTEASKKEGNHLSEEQEKDAINNHGAFIYRDKFSRTGYLNMMKERLVIAKELLTKKGVIFISIDDNEQAYLKVLMDEIFGEENFICNFARKTRAGGGYSGSTIGINLDYVLTYSNGDKSPNKRKT